jgi:hypothetical protein
MSQAGFRGGLEARILSSRTELIADRVWRTRSQLELAVVEYIGWCRRRLKTDPPPPVEN